MIHVVVGTSHLSEIFGHRFDAVLRRTLEKLVGTPRRSVNKPADLAAVTVFEVLEDFHNRASALLRAEPAEVMTAQRDEILRVARDDYHYPDFEATIEDACRSVAIHGLFPHGALKTQGVFLPDFSIGVRCFGFFAWSFSCDKTIAYLRDNRHAYDLQRLECHLCDTIQDVYNRADKYWIDLQAATKPVPEMEFKRRGGEDEYLVIDAIAHGFQGYRSLRRDNPEVPPLGRHRLLSAAAIRQGMAKPLISGFFPISLWQQLKKPAKHFLLHAAELVAAEECRPAYPDVPSSDEARTLSWEGGLAEGDCGFNAERHLTTLRRLGLEAAFRRRREQNRNLERSESGEWAWDWTRAIDECESALYETHIERSLHLQSLLDLYPLHKRVLGLLEDVIVPELGTQADAATRLRLAFADRRHAHRADPAIVSTRQDGVDTSLEITGGWLIFAKDLNAANPKVSGCCLARLIKELIGRINKQFAGGNFRLATAGLTSANQAKQLHFLGQPSLSGRCCLQAMVNILINLRNFIEHGIDNVDDSGLVITNSEFWPRLIDNNWTRNNLPNWHEENSLPHDSNGSITSSSLSDKLFLTPVSLEHCLVLVSLVLHGAKNHLSISYK